MQLTDSKYFQYEIKCTYCITFSIRNTLTKSGFEDNPVESQSNVLLLEMKSKTRMQVSGLA